jgi:hypothetical protein
MRLLFSGLDRLYRTLLRASPAIRAQFGVNRVLVFPLADRFDGTLVFAGTASNAFIGNDIRHVVFSFFFVVL